ncbi:unnamed protein product [Scytosiphon promiscuus]
MLRVKRSLRLPLLLLLPLLLASSARSSCAHNQHKNCGTRPSSLGFQPPVQPVLPGTGSLRLSTPSGARREAISQPRRRGSGSSTVFPQRQQGRQPVGLSKNHRFGPSWKIAALRTDGRSSTAVGADGAGGVGGSAASSGGGSADGATRLRAFETVVQKWCDRATSLFPAWVLGAAVLGMCRPAALAWFNSGLITAALATTMVCMGMTLTLDDFAAVAKRPRPVMAGVFAQYTVMPCLGYLSGRLFNLPPALAAGVTLVGCCPGGTASNLVTLIANGDVALSVSMTTVSTLLAAAVTGPLTKFLVGALVDIKAVTLMKATAQVVFLPVALGLLLNTRAKGVTRRLAPYTPLLCVALVAMICGSVVAANSSILLGSGAALVGAVLTLHAGGFAVGYGGMRACGFTEQEARTASIEVGMQNSALAVVLAQRGLSDPLSAIPGAVSATCHSLIGSALAAYWRTGDRALPKIPPEASASAGGGDGAASRDDLYDAGGGI